MGSFSVNLPFFELLEDANSINGSGLKGEHEMAVGLNEVGDTETVGSPHKQFVRKDRYGKQIPSIDKKHKLSFQD